MKKTAESCLGVSVCDAVVSVPACFNRFQRNATMDACAIAGLNVSTLYKKGPMQLHLLIRWKGISVERGMCLFLIWVAVSLMFPSSRLKMVFLKPSPHQALFFWEERIFYYPNG